MRPSEVLGRATRYLERHGVESPEATAEVLLMHVLETDRAGLYTRERGLDAREARMFGRAICQRCAGVPVQHLTGRQGFRGSRSRCVPACSSRGPRPSCSSSTRCRRSATEPPR